MIEGLLFWLDLALMIYLCWQLIKYIKGQSPDLGLLAFKETEKPQ